MQGFYSEGRRGVMEKKGAPVEHTRKDVQQIKQERVFFPDFGSAAEPFL